MDSNNPNGDYSKSSGDEDSDTAGTGRSYECVFCRRGFTTAQALGGHMNIHRKDRAKNRPHASSISSSSPPISDRNFNYGSFKSFAPVQSYPGCAMASSDHEVHVNYQTFFSSSAWDHHHHHHSQRSLHTNNQQHFEMFGDEIWRGNNHGPSSHVAADHHHHHHHNPYDKEKREGVVSEEEEEEEEEEEGGLDLELRLGHDP